MRVDRPNPVHPALEVQYARNLLMLLGPASVRQGIKVAHVGYGIADRHNDDCKERKATKPTMLGNPGRSEKCGLLSRIAAQIVVSGSYTRNIIRTSRLVIVLRNTTPRR